MEITRETRKAIIASVESGTSQAATARRFGVGQPFVSKLMARWKAQGDSALEPLSRRPKTVPTQTDPEVVRIVLSLRESLAEAGLDNGADTIGWHLQQTHGIHLPRSTIFRICRRAGLVEPTPKRRPKSSYVRFQAKQPNGCWQSDFTHYRLTKKDGSPGRDTNIIAWIDDHSRYLLQISAHTTVTARIVHDTFTKAAREHGNPAETLTDNGMVYTVRLAGGKNQGGRTALEAELAERHIKQKNGRPGHPTTQGKIERFWQTLKKWLTAQSPQPTTLRELNALLAQFQHHYNTERPHRSLPNLATPHAVYTTGVKDDPDPEYQRPAHDRVRTDIVNENGSVTLRVRARLRHIGIGRTRARTHVKLIIHDLDVTIVDAVTAEIIRELTIDPTKDYHGTGKPPGQPKGWKKGEPT